MSYQLTVKLVQIEGGDTSLSGQDEAMLELSALSPDGHRLAQSVVLRMDDEAFMSVGLETEEEARMRGELAGRLEALGWIGGSQ